jgi:hypothetical protein
VYEQSSSSGSSDRNWQRTPGTIFLNDLTNYNLNLFGEIHRGKSDHLVERAQGAGGTARQPRADQMG